MESWVSRAWSSLSWRQIGLCGVYSRCAGIDLSVNAGLSSGGHWLSGSMGMSWGRAWQWGFSDLRSVMESPPSRTSLGLDWLGHGEHGPRVVGYVLVRVITSLLSGPAYWLLTRRLLPSFRIKWGIDRAALRRVRGTSVVASLTARTAVW